MTREQVSFLVSLDFFSGVFMSNPCRSLHAALLDGKQYNIIGIVVVAKKKVRSRTVSYDRMSKLSSSRGIRIDVPVLSVSWSVVDHSVIYKL